MMNEITIYDHETGVTTVREMTETELAELAACQPESTYETPSPA